ncbi:MAG: hypothetical protein QM758_29795 [Armatimonas sp.]
MASAFGFRVAQGVVEFPALRHERITEQASIPDGRIGFIGAHIQPDAGIGAVVQGIYGADNSTAIPPDRGRENSEPTEDLWVLQANVERDEPT